MKLKIYPNHALPVRVPYPSGRVGSGCRTLMPVSSRISTANEPVEKIPIHQDDVQQSSENVCQSDLIRNRNGVGQSEFSMPSNGNERQWTYFIAVGQGQLVVINVRYFFDRTRRQKRLQEKYCVQGISSFHSTASLEWLGGLILRSSSADRY